MLFAHIPHTNDGLINNRNKQEFTHHHPHYMYMLIGLYTLYIVLFNLYNAGMLCVFTNSMLSMIKRTKQSQHTYTFLGSETIVSTLSSGDHEFKFQLNVGKTMIDV